MKSDNYFLKRLSVAAIAIILIFVGLIIYSIINYRDSLSVIEDTFEKNKEQIKRQLLEKSNKCQCKIPMALLFLHDEGGAIGANVFEYVLYDKSDEILLDQNKRTNQWLLDANTQINSLINAKCKIRSRKIEDHYFSIVQTC